jgi:tetratricopeptide (TPR) repeat protein
MRFGLFIFLLFFIATNLLAQPGGGGGATLKFKGMKADSARLFVVENFSNPTWISQSNPISLTEGLMFHHPTPWQVSTGELNYRMEFYQGGKTMRIDIQQLPPENPVGWTPNFDSLQFFEGNWIWNLSPYWPLQEEISKSYGITQYTKATWEKNRFWSWTIPGEMKYSPLYHFNQAMQWRRKREWKKAESSIALAITNARDDNESKIFQTEKLILLKEEEEWKMAKNLAYELLQKYPDDFFLNQHAVALAIRFKEYGKADSCYHVLIRHSPGYEWDYMMFLARYKDRDEEAFARGKMRVMEVENERWEGEPIGITQHCGVWFQMAMVAELTGHIEEASKYAFTAAYRGYGYNMTTILEFEEWSDRYNKYPYFALAYALYLHHTTHYDSEDGPLQQANHVLKSVPKDFYHHADYWWTLGLVNERLQNWEKVVESGKRLVKMDDQDMRGHYLLFRYYGASIPESNPKKSEEHRLKWGELRRRKLESN